MDSKKAPKIDLSVVIPVYNEEDVLPMLIERLDENVPSWGSCEIILVNDGSMDKTYQILKKLVAGRKPYRIINFSRNFGHQAAITAGMEYAEGENVSFIDADLQDPPELITKMMDKRKDGFDIVYAVRQNRKENFMMRFFYKSFYRILRYLAYIEMPLDSGDFSLMSRRVVDTINKLPERTRFIRGLRVWTGFSKTPIYYDRDARAAGEPKFSFSKLIKLAFSGIMSFSTRPLRLSSYLGMIIAFLAFTIGLVLAILRLTMAFNVSGWTSLILVVFFLGGIQLLILGVIGEYIGLIYTEAQGRPTYVVKDEVDFN